MTDAYLRAHGLKVRRGPLAELEFPPSSVGRAHALVAKLVGAYEAEIADAVNDAIGRRYDLFVDVGSAEGYYVGGFAIRSPATRVYAFETDAGRRRICRELLAANGVADRVTLRGTFTREDLDHIPPGRLFVLMDCEGAEVELLRPDELPRLRSATVLVELHATRRTPGVHEAIRSRFADTHDERVFSVAAREPSRYPELAALRPQDHELALFESPEPVGTVRWALYSPRSR